MNTDRSRRQLQHLECLVEQLRERREPRRIAADDREHERVAVLRRAYHRLRAAAHADPRRERPGLGMRHDVLIEQWRAGLALPGHASALEDFGEELGLLLEQLLVVRKVVAEERE